MAAHHCPTGPLFRTFDLRGHLTTNRDFAGNSLRRGFITNAVKKKVPIESIKCVTGQCSNAIVLDVPKDFETQREAFYDALRLPRDPGAFIASLRDEMREALATFNDGLARNAAVRITNKAGGWIGLSPLEPQPEPQNIAALKNSPRRGR